MTMRGTPCTVGLCSQSVWRQPGRCSTLICFLSKNCFSRLIPAQSTSRMYAHIRTHTPPHTAALHMACQRDGRGKEQRIYLSAWRSPWGSVFSGLMVKAMVILSFKIVETLMKCIVLKDIQKQTYSFHENKLLLILVWRADFNVTKEWTTKWTTKRYFVWIWQKDGL